MRAPLKLTLFGLGLAAAFAAAAVTANAVVPQSVVDNWTGTAGDHAGMNDDKKGDEAMKGMDHAADGAAALGLGRAQNGFALTDVLAPTGVGAAGELRLTVRDASGAAVTDFKFEHEKELHLIVVRTDGQEFRHVHPERGTDGVWSIPWVWGAAGTYRVFADFVPSSTGEGVTLSSMVQVSGSFRARPATTPVTEVQVDGYTVRVTGELVAGSASPLTLSVDRDGKPVTTLQPYLGAFGHLVALRDGDLAYLHVHPEGETPTAGELSGPEVRFRATIPTAGRYLLYFDFQVDGRVHSAPLVLDTAGGAASSKPPAGNETKPNQGSDGNEHD
ncbi:hypothetical protein B0O41_2546 [Propionibacteriaceae bacterium ES.041]|uniref:heavy-metal-associated domain-containing protein n=1 Tax=Enemella evansiae TaxID=2016499 RepID=UPI000C00AC84|nr:heavy-metal-associated domain-containing protein [Enemella evansiae]PFG67725.1 hypothetical protein B0O41_2546 [Propionibacteriaceae bacterium ES.041]